MLPFDITFDQAMSFASRKAKALLVLTDSEGASEAVGLYLAIRSALEAMGFGILPTGNIVPH